jgi:arylsulfatase A
MTAQVICAVVAGNFVITMRHLILLSLLSLAVHAQQPQAAKPAPTKLAPEVTAALEAHPDVVYARYGQREMQLDLWKPKAADKPLPAILCIHGGGWYKGERSSMANLAQALAAKGFVTATMSYRLSGEAKFPAAIQDCKAAVRFLRANAAKFGIQSAAIGVTGLSAGGHLAALLSTSGGVRELEGDGGHADASSAVQAGIAMGAQSDLESPRIGELSSKPDDPFYCTFLGDSQSKLPQIYALASPRHHLDRNDPPLLFMTGALDDPSTHATETRPDLEKLGIPTSLVLIPQAPHAFLGQQKAFDTCVSASVEFFTKHLVKK